MATSPTADQRDLRVVPDPRAVPATAPHHEPEHQVTVLDGRFARAVCTCGWTGAGRRARAAARAEARDHALLYAGTVRT